MMLMLLSYYFSSKTTESVLKLSDLQFFLLEKNILSMETTSGQSLSPEGSSIRLFRIPVSPQPPAASVSLLSSNYSENWGRRKTLRSRGGR